MDQTALHESAKRLDELIRVYTSSNKNVVLLYKQLARLIEDACAGRVKAPLDFGRIPGDRIFSETDLSQLKDLEDAFAKFKLELSGGEDDKDRRARKMFERRHGSLP